MKNYLKTFMLIIGAVGFSACSDSEEVAADRFDRSTLLSNVGNALIVPAYEKFAQASADLHSATTAFSNNPTTDNLLTVQNQWKAATQSYKSVEMYDFGPIDQLGLKANIHTWPVSSTNIQSALETSETIDEEYIQNLGTSSKGMAAIEHLLFNPALSQQELVDAFVNNPNKLNFLRALTADVSNVATQISTDWSPDGNNYVNTFVSASGKDVGSSVNTLANKFIQLIEFVKNNKVGIPLGKKSMGTPLPENVEAPESQFSLELIKANLRSVQGTFTGGASGPGFAAYLDAVDAQYEGRPLSGVIANQIEACLAAAAAIDMPLEQAVVQEPEQVETLYAALQQLVIYAKTDMMSSLGLLVTFSDNDGD